jgi:hypothetical protein
MDQKSTQYPIEGFDREFFRIEEFIEAIKALISNLFFLNFFAPEGFAKSYILDKTWEKYERTLPVSLVQVKNYIQDNKSFLLSDLLQKILADLEERLPRRVVNLPIGYRQVTNEAQLAEYLVHQVENIQGTEKVVLLLIDDYDLMPDDASRWFESAVLGPLVRTRKVGTILTSKFELVFNDEFDLRMRLDRYEVSSLNIEAISRSFPKYQGVASEIYMLTGGMMNLTRNLVQELENSKITPGNFHEYERELMQKYYQQFIEQFILLQYPDKKIRDTLLVLSLLRRFDSRMLENILPQAMPEYYDPSNLTNYYIDLIQSMGNNIQWRSQGGYTIIQALRMALQGYVRFTKPELYKKVNMAAIGHYRDLLKHDYREYYLVELIYHEIIFHRFEKGLGLFPLQEKVGTELAEYLNGDSAALVREDDLDALRNSLKQDPDISMYVSDEALKTIDLQIRVRIYENQIITQKQDTSETL